MQTRAAFLSYCEEDAEAQTQFASCGRVYVSPAARSHLGMEHGPYQGAASPRCGHKHRGKKPSSDSVESKGSYKPNSKAVGISVCKDRQPAGSSRSVGECN